MQILAASVDMPAAAGKAADAFLHAGYISAYPRPLWSHAYGNGTTVVQLDMVDALRLKGETIAAAVTGGDGTLAAAATANWEWAGTLAVAAGFFGFVGLLYLLQERFTILKQGWRVAAVAGLALASFALTTCFEDPLPSKPPWEETQLQEYENPEMATKAILYGIVADGVQNVGESISSLANIQNEVGLPTATPTEGMAYALSTYGIDGWGREFRLEKETGAYDVRSAGPDGEFDNADDLGIKVSQCDDESWDQERLAWFLRRDGDKLNVFFHRWSGGHFEYNNEADAVEATGSKLFDLFTQDQLGDADDESRLTAATAAFDGFAAAGDHEPIVLQVFSFGTPP
jgi:hypothetical protein